MWQTQAFKKVPKIVGLFITSQMQYFYNDIGFGNELSGFKLTAQYIVCCQHFEMSVTTAKRN